MFTRGYSQISRSHTHLCSAMAAEDAPPCLRDAGLGANRKRMGHPAGWVEHGRTPPNQGHVSSVSGNIWKYHTKYLEVPRFQDIPRLQVPTRNRTGLYLNWWHHQSSIHEVGSREGQPALTFKLFSSTCKGVGKSSGTCA